ncbi:lytic transglycosylase domain-containing protein [Sphingobium aromaticivastans]|uniref:lytic transglycosylase domain-containing protein n=1 Tax=Sphingobium aromaticivastans TaxID=1778665 RepID=UPI00301A1FED
MRRAFLLAGMMVVGTCMAHAAAAQTLRTVQLIRMGAVPSADGPADPSAPADAAAPPFAVQTDAFAGGPTRPSVEIQMATSFAQGLESGQESRSIADPVGPGRFSPSTDAIAIPSWMTGGPLYGLPSPRWVPDCLSIAYRPTGFLRADVEGRRQVYYGLMSQIACEFGIPVGLFDAMIIQESGYRHHVFSSKNAYGLTQLMPGTAAELGVDRYAVDQNLRGGARYLRQQLDRFGQVHLALAAYNAGPGRIRKAMVPRIRQTRLYVDDILRNWSRLSGLAVPGAWPETQVSTGDRQDMAPYRMAQVSTF